MKLPTPHVRQSELFRALQKAWYERLARDGFIDAEEVLAGGSLALRQKAANVYRGLDPLAIRSREDYYRFMQSRVQTAEFKSEVDRLVLHWWADGLNAKDICTELALIGELRHRNSIRYLVRRYEMRWGLKYFTVKELNGSRVWRKSS